MIKKLQRKFILITGMAVILMMICLIVPINLINHFRIGQEMEETLRYIIQSDGDVPAYAETEAERTIDLVHVFSTVLGGSTGVSLTPESRYQLRYFLVYLDEDGNISDISLSHIAAVDEEEARSLTKRAQRQFLDHGFVHKGQASYYYVEEENTDGTRVLGFLDCTRELNSVNLFYYSSLGFGFLLVVVVLILIAFISRKAMQPYIDNMESQREFITNAGHELKTPLAIISANTEVIEMINGKSEWTESILAQVKRGTSLINDLITLSRTSEAQEIVLVDVDFTKTVEESANSFRPVIEQQGKTLNVETAEHVTVKADQKLLTEMVNILVDNAAKYCDDAGTINVVLKKHGRGGGILTVSNDYKDGKDVDYSRFFQRFYRADTSHNSKKSGYGIGLSMAQTIAVKMKGNLAAGWKNGVITFTVTLRGGKADKTDSPGEQKTDKTESQGEQKTDKTASQ